MRQPRCRCQRWSRVCRIRTPSALAYAQRNARPVCFRRSAGFTFTLWTWLVMLFQTALYSVVRRGRTCSAQWPLKVAVRATSVKSSVPAGLASMTTASPESSLEVSPLRLTAVT